MSSSLWSSFLFSFVKLCCFISIFNHLPALCTLFYLIELFFMAEYLTVLIMLSFAYCFSFFVIFLLWLIITIFIFMFDLNITALVVSLIQIICGLHYFLSLFSQFYSTISALSNITNLSMLTICLPQTLADQYVTCFHYFLSFFP